MNDDELEKKLDILKEELTKLIVALALLPQSFLTEEQKESTAEVATMCLDTIIFSTLEIMGVNGYDVNLNLPSGSNKPQPKKTFKNRTIKSFNPTPEEDN